MSSTRGTSNTMSYRVSGGTAWRDMDWKADTLLQESEGLQLFLRDRATCLCIPKAGSCPGFAWNTVHFFPLS